MIRYLLPAFGIVALLFVLAAACILLSALISSDDSPKPWDDDEREYPAGTFSENERL